MRDNNEIQDVYSVLKLLIKQGKKTHGQLADYLFPHLSAASADSRLSDCFNRDVNKRAQLSIQQLINAMKFCDCYLPLHYLCEETGHHRPERKAPDDVEFRLAKAITDAAATLKAAMDQLEKHKSR